MPKDTKLVTPYGVWERGYRVHGLWRDGVRVAHIGLSPYLPGRTTVYSWEIDGTEHHGQESSLRTARAAVHRGFRRIAEDQYLARLDAVLRTPPQPVIAKLPEAPPSNPFLEKCVRMLAEGIGGQWRPLFPETATVELRMYTVAWTEFGGKARLRSEAICVRIVPAGLSVGYTTVGDVLEMAKVEMQHERVLACDAVRISLGGDPDIPDLAQTVREIRVAWGRESCQPATDCDMPKAR